MHSRRLLVMDDESGMRRLVRDVAERRGFEVRTASTREEFQAAVAAFLPQVIALDLHLGDTDGIEILKSLARSQCNAQVLLMSGQDLRTLHSALRVGQAHGLTMLPPLSKPFSVGALGAMLDGLVANLRCLSEAELRAAIEKHELVLHYQPKVDLGSRRLCGVEALVRWQHPTHGLLQPGEFLPLVARADMMRPLTQCVLDMALRQCREWRELGLEIPVAVNFGAENLSDPTLVARIEAMLEDHGVEPNQLVVEITESSAMTDPTAALEILTRLRIRGIEVSLDDFGTGYSSLAELQRMPFSELKIDRSFVGEATRLHDAEVIVRTIVGLGRNLGLRVVAEGVENSATWDFLCGLGCDQAQGYLLTRPLEAKALVAWTRSARTGPLALVG